MKQAFLLGVYKNPEYVRQLILSLSSDKTNIYVHINKDNYETFLDVIDFFKEWHSQSCFLLQRVWWFWYSLLADFYAQSRCVVRVAASRCFRES